MTIADVTVRRVESPESGPESGAGLAVVRALPFDGDDVALVTAMRAGRADALAAFYNRNARNVHGLVFRLMGPDREIEDVVHDVFVRALESLSRLRDPNALRGWLSAIAVRTVHIRFQRRRRQSWLRFFAPEEIPEAVTNPETEIGEALGDVYAILKGMDAEERIALVLHRVEGLPLDDAAAAANMSLATFRRRLARAEEKFFARASSRPSLEEWIGKGKR